MKREFGFFNLMNTPEHCSAPFHSVNSKVAKSTKMAAAHSTNICTTCNMVYTVHISDHYLRDHNFDFHGGWGGREPAPNAKHRLEHIARIALLAPGYHLTISDTNLYKSCKTPFGPCSPLQSTTAETGSHTYTGTFRCVEALGCLGYDWI